MIVGLRRNGPKVRCLDGSSFFQRIRGFCQVSPKRAVRAEMPRRFINLCNSVGSPGVLGHVVSVLGKGQESGFGSFVADLDE